MELLLPPRKKSEPNPDEILIFQKKKDSHFPVTLPSPFQEFSTILLI